MMSAAHGDSARRAEPGPGELWKVLQLILWSAEYLTGKGVDSARLDAEHLLAHILGMDRLQLYLDFDRPMSEGELAAFKPLLLRRGSREPLQHILGQVGFRELDLKSDRRGLIPRQETELLVGVVLEWAARHEKESLIALEIGTGTAAIALSLLVEGPFERVIATDVDLETLALARENSLAQGVGDRIDLRVGDVFEPVREDERFDVVVSNPPYVEDGCEPDLQPEVRDFDPARALYGGPEGLDVLTRVISGAADRLFPGGLLGLEIGAGQAVAVTRLIEETGKFESPTVMQDLANQDRVVHACRLA